MAIGILYTGSFYSERNGSITVNILKEGASSATPIEIVDLRTTYEGDSNGFYTTSTQGSATQLTILVDTNTSAGAALNTFLTGLVGNESELFIEVKRNDSREWVGRVLIDIAEVEDAPIYDFTLTAACGLGQLDDYYFDLPFTTSDEHFTFYDALRAALGATFVDQLYDATTPYITLAIPVRNSIQNSSLDPLSQHRLPVSAFTADYVEGKRLSCGEVVRRILDIFGARIRMHNGHWHVIAPFAYGISSTIKLFTRANVSGSTSPTVTDVNTAVGVGNAAPLNTLAGNTFTYKPALIRADVDYKPISAFYVKKAYNDTALYREGIPVKNLDIFPIRISGNITYEVPRAIINGVNTVLAPVDLRITVALRQGSDDKYKLDFNNSLGFYWIGAAGANAELKLPFALIKDASLTDSQDFDLILPPNNDTEVDNIAIYLYVVSTSPTCQQTLSFSVFLNFQQQFNNGTYQDDVRYTTSNQQLINNSVYHRKEIFYGDDQNIYNSSAIEVNASGTWLRSELWYTTNDTFTTLPIGMLLSRTYMQMQRIALQNYQGNLYFSNALSVLNIVNYGDDYFYFNAGEIDWKQQVINGNWIKLSLLTTSIGLDTGKPNRGPLDTIDRKVEDIYERLRKMNGIVNGLDRNQQGMNNRIDGLNNQLNQKQDDIWSMLNLGSYTGGDVVVVMTTDEFGNPYFKVAT